MNWIPSFARLVAASLVFLVGGGAAPAAALATGSSAGSSEGPAAVSTTAQPLAARSGAMPAGQGRGAAASVSASPISAARLRAASPASPLAGQPGAQPPGAPLASLQSEEAEAPAEPDSVLIMRVDGPIDAGHQALFRRAVVTAKANGSPLIVAFDTPGGELTRMRQFAGAIDAAVNDGVRVIGWVDDQALSAGTWLAIACQSLYVRERSSIGAAQAVQLTPTGMVPAGEKIASAYRAWVRGWAKTHGKNELLAEAMIDPGTEVRRVRLDGIEQDISGARWDDLVAQGNAPELIRTVVPEGTLLALTGAEAIQYGFADAMAESPEALLSKEGLAGMPLEPLDKTRSEDLLASLHGMRLLLLFLGLFFGYVELKVPGFGIPGGLSILCFIGLFVGQYLIGLADIPHVVLATLGVVLVGTEIFVVPGMIWPGLVGATCLVVGLLMSQVGPDLSMGDAWDRQLLFDATFQLVATAAAGVFAIWTLSRFLPQTPLLGRMVLAGAGGAADAMPEAHDATRQAHARPGALGTASTDLRPVGKVALDGDEDGVYHEARIEGGVLERGARVTVLEVSAGRLLVAAVGSVPPERPPASSAEGADS